MHHAFQHFALAPQLLRAFGILPDSGVFGECADFGQTFPFDIEVKDTSVIRRCADLNLAID
jgi:hypothetical protein